MALSIDNPIHPLHVRPGEQNTAIFARKSFTQTQKLVGVALMISAVVAAVFAAPPLAIAGLGIVGGLILGSAFIQEVANPTVKHKGQRVFTGICFAAPIPGFGLIGSFSLLILNLREMSERAAVARAS